MIRSSTAEKLVICSHRSAAGDTADVRLQNRAYTKRSSQHSTPGKFCRLKSVKFQIRVAMCVCVFSHSFWTSSSLDVPAGVTQEEGHTGFFIHLPSAVRALIFLARRIQPFLSLVDREVEFCVLTI